MRYLICAYEDLYERYHGIRDIRIENFIDEKEAYWAAKEMALDVINNYLQNEYEELYQEECDFNGEHYMSFDEFLMEHIEWNIWEIPSSLNHIRTKELDNFINKEGLEAFIEKYKLEEI